MVRIGGFKRLMMAVVLAASVGGVLAGGAPAQAAGCTTNHYRVNHTPSAVWDYDTPRWLRDKRAGEAVAGPNSNVMDNYRDGWRVVYLGGGGLGRVWADYLDYVYCD